MSAETKPPAAVDQRVSAIGLQPLQSNGMKYRNLGRSGLRVSAVGVGCFPFGGLMDDQIVQSTVDCAIDLGINYFDTSDSYGIGKSESSLGRALLGKRSKAVIATKFGNRTGDEANDTGASRTHIIEACEASLRRLQTDHIDVYQVHWPDHNTPIEETLRALDDLVRQGKVRYIGCANFFEWEICEALWTSEKHGLAAFSSAQDFYNLLYRDIEKRMEPFCVKYGVGMISYFPLAGGLLSGAYKRDTAAPIGTRGASNPNYAAWQSDRNWRVQEKLNAFSQSRGWTLPQMSLAWMLSRPAMATLIAGADKPQHLLDNVKALDVRFTEEDLTEIDRITLVDEDRSVAPVYRKLRPEKVHEFETRQAAKAIRG